MTHTPSSNETAPAGSSVGGSPVRISLAFSELCELAAQVGLVPAWVLARGDAEAALSTNAAALRLWQQRGFSGEMQYMQRDSELFSGFDHILPETRSIVGFVLAYAHGQRSAPLLPGHGRVARYAWGRDYHRVIGKRLRRLLALIAELHPRAELRWRSFTDAVPLLERALAARGSGGFIGKNTMLIVPGTGSFTFLAEILWNIELGDLPPMPESPKRDCGSCTRCLDHCPTSAFVAPYTLDARRCISYLTIEKKGPLEEWERRALGEWIFGCDICQEVCPFNHKGTIQQEAPEFSAASGAGGQLALLSLFQIKNDEDFKARFAGSPLMRPGREGLLRNACSVAVNTRCTGVIPELSRAAASDPSPLVRTAAEQAIAEFAAL